MYIGSADVLTSETKNGEVRVNIGDKLDNNVGLASSAPVWGLDGFISRPSDADADGATQALYYQEGNQRRVVAMRNNRVADKVGALEPGDRAIVSSGNARFFLKDAKDVVSLYTESATTSIYCALSGDDESLELGVGLTKIRITATGIHLIVNGGPAILVCGVGDPAIPSGGCQIIAGVVNVDGGFVTVGLISVQTRPGPQDIGLANALVGPGPFGLPAPKVLVANH